MLQIWRSSVLGRILEWRHKGKRKHTHGNQTQLHSNINHWLLRLGHMAFGSGSLEDEKHPGFSEQSLQGESSRGL